MSVTGPAATPASDKRAESAASTPANAGQQPVAATDPNPISPGVRYRDEIYQAAKAHGVDPLLLAAQGAQESGGPASNSGNNVKQHGGGGRGVFQIDEGTYRGWLKSHGDGMNVRQNANKAASIDAANLRRTHGDVAKAMHLYNAGNLAHPSSTTRFPDGTVRSYEDAVEQHYHMLGELQAKSRH